MPQNCIRSGKSYQMYAIFTLGTLVSSTNKTDCHDINEILLKVALYTINQTNPTMFTSSEVPFLHFQIK